MLFQLLFAAESAVETAVETVAATTASESQLAAMSIFSKGLFTTLLGLIGVFLVLTLFYISIKLIQRSGKSKTDTEE